MLDPTTSPRPSARLLAAVLAASLAIPSLAFASGDAPAPSPSASGGAASTAPPPAPSSSTVPPAASSAAAPVLTPADVHAPPSDEAPPSVHPGAAGPSPGSGPPWERTVALVSAGVAIAASVGGLVYGGLAFSRKSSAESVCPGAVVCSTPEGVHRWNDAETAANTSTVLFFAAGLAALGAVVFWLVPTDQSTRAMQVGLGPGAFQLRGAFP